MDIQFFFQLELGIESIFALDCILKFFSEYVDDQSDITIRDHGLIGQRYLKQGFMIDIIPLIPFFVVFKFKYARLLYLLKLFRILAILQMIDTKKFMDKVKEFY
jgi:hypothetical protein